MTTTPIKPLAAAFALGALLGALTLGATARADDFGRPSTEDGAGFYLNQQAANAQFSDPTARDSLRSHGHP